MTPALVVIRGNSGSGKTTAAREVRRRYGRGCALREQDYFRRVVLREHGGLGGEAVAPGFINVAVRHLLGAGYHVVVEGILHSGSYGLALRQLIAEHQGPSHVFYLDVSFDETVCRHHGRAEPVPVIAREMQGWYTERDLLGVDGEHVIPEASTLEQTVTTIIELARLRGLAPATPCPVRCPRCTAKQDTAGGAIPAATSGASWAPSAGPQ